MVRKNEPPELNVVRINPGARVRCDLCGVDYTGRPECGGIYAWGKAICPSCAPRYEQVVKKAGEEIDARCPERMAFARWVLENLRG